MCLDTIYFAEYWNLKTENNKKVTVHSQVTVHLPTCAVNVYK